MHEANPPQLLLGEWSNRITTRSGVRLDVRPAAPEDEALLETFFGQVTSDDLRFRFLSPVKKPGHDLVAPLVDVDHTTAENFLAFADDGETLVATAMIAADPSLERAEVAIAVRADFKHKGVGWSLLQLVADYAKARGIVAIESIEARDNREAIGLEQEMGFTASSYPGDATLVLLRRQLG
ncbi:MAG: GNAT family N-acetyltransferase [Allosphingosinicella sp.]